MECCRTRSAGDDCVNEYTPKYFWRIASELLGWIKLAPENKSDNHEGHEGSRRKSMTRLLRATSDRRWLSGFLFRQVQRASKLIGMALLALTLALPIAAQEEVRIQVDAGVKEGAYPPVWAFFGYDEPNYTYM